MNEAICGDAIMAVDAATCHAFVGCIAVMDEFVFDWNMLMPAVSVDVYCHSVSCVQDDVTYVRTCPFTKIQSGACHCVGIWEKAEQQCPGAHDCDNYM